jgi:tRNA A-37 threonylcarbamoyl transferase component Bud32
MSTDAGIPREEQLAPLLVAYEKALAAGASADSSAENLPPELRPELEGAQACIQLLHQVLPRRNVAESLALWAEKPTARTEPRRLGDYELREKLGQGGMGAVYKAVHTRLGKTVALKVLASDRYRDGRLVARFHREMRALGGLQHPNIVQALDAREEDGVPFLVMEYVAGLNLGRLVERAGPLPVADACEVVRQAALGLHHAYQSQGLVHRDLKPSNLMLTPEGGVKVLDLGLAWFPRTAADGPAPAGVLSGPGERLGTPDYMAPEQWLDSHVDVRADVYGLGCTLYHLVTGQPPFAGAAYDTLSQKMHAHRQEAPAPVQRLRPEVPDDLGSVLARMLAKEPTGRLATPAAVADALLPFTAGHDLANLPGAWTGTPARPAPDAVARPAQLSWPKGRARAALAVAVLVVGVLAFAGLRGSREHPEPHPLPEVRTFQVNHYAVRDGKTYPRGQLGLNSFTTRFGDQVKVKVELTEPAYCYLIALNPNGQVQPWWPLDWTQSGLARLSYPADTGNRTYFTLDDEPRGGLQAFVLLLARKPLPVGAHGWSGLQGLPWRRLDPPARVVWDGRDGEPEPQMPDDEDQRGTIADPKGLEPLFETVRQLRRSPGVDKLAVKAFPVLPREGN